MKLKGIEGANLFNEYHCELTDELDKLSGLDDKDSVLHHYVIVDDHSMKNRCLPIRIPGGTVGGVWFNENLTIIKIIIDTNYVVKTYPDDVNEVVQKYVGKVLEL